MQEDKANPMKPVSDFLSRYNLVIFIIIIVGGLIAAILDLSYILRSPYSTTDSNNTTNNNITLDNATINKLNKMKVSSENTTQTLPSGRTNPFSEN